MDPDFLRFHLDGMQLFFDFFEFNAMSFRLSGELFDLKSQEFTLMLCPEKILVELFFRGEQLRQSTLCCQDSAFRLRDAEVRFFGFVPPSTLAALYRMASVFAFPSLYEGFGLPPLEAMSCGTPVVTSRMAALNEVVDDAAVLVDAYSVEDIAGGISRVLDDGDLRNELIQKGLARARKFSWERSVRAIHAGYFKALDRALPDLAEAAR